MLFHSCTHKKGILQLNLWYISLFIKQPVSQSTGQGAVAQLLGSQPSGPAPAAAGAAANGSHLQPFLEPTISWVEPTCAWVTLPCTCTHIHTRTHIHGDCPSLRTDRDRRTSQLQGRSNSGVIYVPELPKGSSQTSQKPHPFRASSFFLCFPLSCIWVSPETTPLNKSH